MKLNKVNTQLSVRPQLLPPIYWKAMLRGKEWLAQPEIVN